MKNKELIEEYARLKQEEKAVALRLEELKPQVFETLESTGLDREHPIELSSIGTFSLGVRRTWKYTPEVLKAEAILKAKKKEEEQLGTAEYVENPYLIFKSLDEE